METIQIREYGSFIIGKENGIEVGGNITLTERTFGQLEEFLLANSNKETDALELMGLSARKGVGKIITAKNYVGILSLADGTTIEILPKIISGIADYVEIFVFFNNAYKILFCIPAVTQQNDIFHISKRRHYVPYHICRQFEF